MTTTNTSSISPAKKFLVTRLFPWSMIAVGIFSLWLGINEIVGGIRSTNWPSVEGTITESYVETVAHSSSGSSHASRTFHAAITYTYRIDGVAYEGTRVAFGELGREDPAFAQAIVERYPVEQVVDVYYNPNRPNEALLEPGRQGGTWFWTCLGIPFLLMGILMHKILPGVLAEQEKG